MSPSQVPHAQANRSLRRWGTIASVLIAMQVGIGLIFLLPEVEELVYGPLVAGSDELTALFVVVFGGLLFYAGAALAFLMWTRRAAWNLRVLHPDAAFTFTPGWCVGWWFVPLANLIKPLHAMHEIWHYSDPEAEQVDPETGYTRHVTWGKDVPALLVAWWVVWVVMSVLDNFVGRADHPPGVLVGLGSVVSLGAAVLCILVVQRVTAMQRESFARFAKAPDVASSLGHVVGRADEAE